MKRRAVALLQGPVLPVTGSVTALGATAAVGLTVVGLGPAPVAWAGTGACAVLAAVHSWVRSPARSYARAVARPRSRRDDAWFAALVRGGSDAALVCDGTLQVTWVAPALGRLLGRTAAEALRDAALPAVVHPDDVATVDALRAGPPASGLVEFRLRHVDGSWRRLEAAVADLRSGAVAGLVLHCRDVTERRERETELSEVAYTDDLTGLPNRAAMTRAVGRVLPALAADTHPEDGTTAALLHLTVEGLDEADRGREVHDQLLAEVARRLRATVRGEDPVARTAAATFTVLAHGTAAEVDRVAARCLTAVEQPIATAEGIVDLTGGLGVVDLAPGMQVEDVLTRVEQAAQAARTRGPGVAVRWSPELGEAAQRRTRLRADVVGACARGELALAYQPVVAIADHRVTGVEALLRWRHPELGEVPPGEFVPLAEQAGVVGEIERWVLREATAALAGLPAPDGVPLRLGVNVSARHVGAGTLVADVAAALEAAGLAPEQLVLEVGEATVLGRGDAGADVRGADTAGADVTALRLMGVHVALDDFGSGVSSLSSLVRLPVDVLKLDRVLLSRLDRDPRARALLRSLVATGEALGLEVVAEGVETAAQLSVLTSLGCAYAQGFLLSRPVSLEALRRLLAEGAGKVWPGLVASA